MVEGASIPSILFLKIKEYFDDPCSFPMKLTATQWLTLHNLYLKMLGISCPRFHNTPPSNFLTKVGGIILTARDIEKIGYYEIVLCRKNCKKYLQK